TAHERLASALFRQAKYDEALAEFRKALEMDPDYYPALNGVGVSMLNKYLLSDKKDLDAREEALKALRRSLQIEHRQPTVVDLTTGYGGSTGPLNCLPNGGLQPGCNPGCPAPVQAIVL